MKRFFILIVILNFVYTTNKAQNNTAVASDSASLVQADGANVTEDHKNLINQYDSLGKKNGKWMVYLDKDWKHIEDSLSAFHYRYTYYVHGTNLYPMGPCGKDGYKLESSNIGRSKLLHGEYKWYDTKGRITSIHILNHGEYISCKEFFHSGKLSQHFDYTKKCKGETHGWHAYIYNNEGEMISETNMCRDKHGHWPHTKD